MSVSVQFDPETVESCVGIVGILAIVGSNEFLTTAAGWRVSREG